MSREYFYFDEPRLRDQLQKSAATAYCDGGAIETAPSVNALATAGAILKDESRTSAFYERLFTVTAAAVQSELNVAYAPEFQKLRKRAMAMDPPQQLLLNFARSSTSLIVQYTLRPASSRGLSKGLQIDHHMPSDTASCAKFDDLADVRAWLDRRPAQQPIVAKPPSVVKPSTGGQVHKAAAPTDVAVELGDKHEAANLIKSLHHGGGAPLLRRST
jgi:hypothetical protein